MGSFVIGRMGKIHTPDFYGIGIRNFASQEVKIG